LEELTLLNKAQPTNMAESKKFFTALENCDVIRPDGTPPYLSMEARPVYDEVENSAYNEPIYNGKDGNYIVWEMNGNVTRYTPDGTKTIWYKRTTLQDVVNSKLEGCYTKFNSDGSVYDRTPSYVWFFGPKNIVCEPYEIHAEGYIDDDDCGCHGHYRCCGYRTWRPYDN
jgi:hypothetical protein